MNSSEFLSLINDLIIEQKVLSNINLCRVDWKYQESSKESILFFKSSSQLSEDWFNENIQNVEKAICITDDKKTFEDLKGNKVFVSKKNWLEVQKRSLDYFYPFHGFCKLIGVTGTNGKTSTVHLVDQIAQMNGFSSATCGTLGVLINGEEKNNFSLTTPSFIDIRKILHEYEKKVDIFSFELSSHALDQKRMYKINFDAIGWTNISQDHFDYHQNFEKYFEAKKKIINYSNNKVLIPRSQKSLLGKLTGRAIPVEEIDDERLKGSPYQFGFSRDNLELACTLLKESLGKNLEIKIEKIKGTPGRNQKIIWGSKNIVIDFAHTPDALKNICEELQRSYHKSSLSILFGCGGDRDRMKRPLMAEIVEVYGDRVYLTSDNPRFEDPKQIVEDALKGFKKPKKVKVIIDRRECLKVALSELSDGDVLLVAGKGHEPYIDIKGRKIPYSDEEEIQKIIL